jgi:hypothetical protein
MCDYQWSETVKTNMLKSKYLVVRRALVSLVLLWGIFPVSGADWKTLPGHVPPVTQQLTATGQLPATNQLQLAIGLPLRDAAGLDDFLAQVYDPASPNYHQYLTPEQFADMFGPTEQDYEAVKTFAQANGLTVTTTYGNRLVLDVVGPAAAVEKAFHITLRTYRHPTEARDFFAPDAEPTVDGALPVVDIQGLSNFWRPHPKLHRMDAAKVANAMPRNGSAPDGSGNLFGNDFRNAYVPGVTLTGAGQMVGLLEFDGYYSSDIATYAEKAGNGRANIVIQTVLLDGFNGVPTTGPDSGSSEVSLDIEMAMAMAPGLAKIVVFEGGPNGWQNDILSAMAASNTVKNLSCCWGWGGGPSTTTDNIFKSISAAGQSFFNASGDSEAYTTGANSINGVDNPSLDNAPSSSPYITQVGGTTLTMNGAGASYASETVWNWGDDEGGYTGSGGGISSYYSIPSWQTSVSNMAGRGGSTSFRNIPDVALNADNVYVTYGDGSSDEFGGTSCATPMWAGFMAMVNQQAAANGKPSAGFINPAIYTIASGANYAECFHDVTTGNNTWPGSPDLFYAKSGYDLCTGLGTPAGQNLINALVSTNELAANALVVSPLSGAAAGVAGGPFSITPGSFLLTNSSSSQLTWSLIGTPAWLNFSATNGTLAGAAHINLTCSLTATASNLAVGTYTGNLIFSNWTSHATETVLFTLQVDQPLVVSPTNGFAASGPAGGAFSVTSQSYTLKNQSVSSLSWSIINTSSWLSASPSSGTLAGSGQTTVTVSLAAAANSLALGTYTANVLVTNRTGLAVSLPFTLQVNQPLVVSPTNGFASSGPVGGPFNETSQSYTLNNQSVSSLPWGIINTSSWLSASPSSGTLAGSGQTSLTISLTTAANSLASGIYTANVLVTNRTGEAATLPFTINVGNQSIVINGGFETGSFSGWTLNASSEYNLVTDNGGYVHSGNYGAALGQSGSLGYLYQTLKTSPGQNYLLSLWVENPSNGYGATPNQFLVQWNGTTLFNQANMPFGGWTHLQFTVKATSASTVLQFGFEDTPWYLGLDDISVTPISSSSQLQVTNKKDR